MTKTITIDWKGGSRRVELQAPNAMRHARRMAMFPDPIKFDDESLLWMQKNIVLGSELDMETVESMGFTDAVGLLSEVLQYWQEERGNPAREDSDKGGDSGRFADFDLNDNGAVDLDDMQ